jgi:acyl-CoA synthetase (AMP-forming)/AMP-acid ligase II
MQTKTGLASLVDVLEQRAAEHPTATAFVFVAERGDEHRHLSYGELHDRALAVAASLAERVAPGERAVLLFPPGLDFIVAFFGCLAAGVIAVPLMPPRRTADRDSSDAIIGDCSPSVAMTTPELLERRPEIAERFAGAGFDWLPVSSADHMTHSADATLPRIRTDEIAFLQYTSGSTSTPKGVVIAHDNLLANLEMIRVAMSSRWRSTFVGWVPHYHDMGLMMGVMQPLYLGGTSVLMAPAAFMQRPLNWLRIIHQYRAELACGPNFAYELCASRFRPEQMEGVDLSCCKLALNGAEPVHAVTLERFSRTFAPYGFDPGALYPAYGLAEATLLVTGSVRGHGWVTRNISRAALQCGEVTDPTSAHDRLIQVSCGQSVGGGGNLAIVDPETQRRVPSCCIGEIWVSGPHVAHGYWRNIEATNETFHAKLPGLPGQSWLRTGDLGFVDEQGALFITGRIKDLIIIRGVNHYPQDIEWTVQASDPALRRDCGAAFAISDDDGSEKLAVVQEVERTSLARLNVTDVVSRIREAVVRQHDIAPAVIALIPPATLPKTTSGKIQRSLTRKLYMEGALKIMQPAADAAPPDAHSGN